MSCFEIPTKDDEQQAAWFFVTATQKQQATSV